MYLNSSGILLKEGCHYARKTAEKIHKNVTGAVGLELLGDAESLFPGTRKTEEGMIVI